MQGIRNLWGFSHMNIYMSIGSFSLLHVSLLALTILTCLTFALHCPNCLVSWCWCFIWSGLALLSGSSGGDINSIGEWRQIFFFGCNCDTVTCMISIVIIHPLIVLCGCLINYLSLANKFANQTSEYTICLVRPN